jgi:hypothetical protein
MGCEVDYHKRETTLVTYLFGIDFSKPFGFSPLPPVLLVKNKIREHFPPYFDLV